MNAMVQWRRRVLRISSLCEIAFGSLWLSNAVRPYSPAAGLIALLIGAVGLAASIRTTHGTAPRPSGDHARTLEREVTIASAIQIVVSIAVPAVLVATRHGDLVMPVIIVTVGGLFVWLNRLLDVPRLGALGAALIATPIATLAALSGNAQTTAMLVGAGTLMAANGIVGVRATRASELLRRLPAEAPDRDDESDDAPHRNHREMTPLEARA